MRVVHLTSVHQPFDVRIFVKECSALAKTGHDVYLIAPIEASTTRNNVNIVAVDIPGNRFQRMCLTTFAIFRKALELNGDLYHFHDPELIPVGILLSLLGKKVVYDVHEETANTILDKTWIWPPLRKLTAKLVDAFENFSTRYFDAIIITRNSLFKKFDRNKTILVHNFPILSELFTGSSLPIHQRPLIGAYVGGASPNRGIKELVEALGLLPDDFKFELSIAGIISPPEFCNQLKTLPGWKRVNYLGWQSRSQVADLLSSARFGIVTFLPIANHLKSEPTKLFEYMSAGIPVIASNFPHWESFVLEEGIGVLVDPKDPQAVADAIVGVINDAKNCEIMGQKGREVVLNQYNWEIEEAKLINLYADLLKS